MLFCGLNNRLVNPVIMIGKLCQSFCRNPLTSSIRVMRKGGIFFKQLQRITAQTAFWPV